MIGDDETNFPHKLSLTNRQVSNLCKAFANYLSTDIKLLKTQISKMIQSGGFLSRLIGPLLKIGLPLMKNVIKPLAISVLMPLGLNAAVSAADSEIHKKILGSGRHSSSSAPHNNTILIVSNDEMKDVIEIVKSLEDSGFKGVSETIQNEAKEQRRGFLSMLLGTLGVNLLGNILAGRGINRSGEVVIRAGYGNKKGQKRQDYKKKMGFQCLLKQTLKHKYIIKMRLDLMVVILEIIYKK